MELEQVLVVDDDEALLYLMRHHLESQGYLVESAGNPFQGLELIKTKGPFAVLVTDLMMPYMDGVQLLRKARQLDSRLEVIVITAAGSMETAIAAMREDGAYNYLMKPLGNINELSLAVRRAASYRQLQLEREALLARTQAEAARLQHLIANIGDAILAADEQGKLTVINPTAARLLGRNNLIGSEALAALPRPLATLLSNWQATDGRRPAVIEITWPANATQMVSLTPIGDGATASGWVMAVRDISHLKQLDDLKTQMLVDTANKIRKPLAQAMNLLTELNNPAAVPAERLNEIVFQLVRTWKRIQQWADDLLQLAQYDSGLGATTTAVDLAPLLTDLVANLPQDFVRTKRLKFELNLPTNLGPVRADPALLTKAFQGLITRAIVRSERGTVVRLTAYEQDWQIWIDINDGGGPIATADLPHLFERSYEGVGSGYDSTGLELATAKTIIDKLGGQVWVRNVEEIGSTITICLPTTFQQGDTDAAATVEP
jgi:two-component system, OmpR family, sensor histidine kinase ResE